MLRQLTARRCCSGSKTNSLSSEFTGTVKDRPVLAVEGHASLRSAIAWSAAVIEGTTAAALAMGNPISQTLPEQVEPFCRPQRLLPARRGERIYIRTTDAKGECTEEERMQPPAVIRRVRIAPASWQRTEVGGQSG